MLNQKKTNGGDIILTGYVSDDDKWSLYKFSSIIVIPSLYEGYGIQISEAYSMRKLLAVSDIPVFREVAGNGASFFNPLDKRSISNTISQTLQDKKLQKKLSGEQINIIRRLQWDDVARSMVEMIYKSLHNIDS
jgi:glycosyltransferase involved in cell wall biosynthesis